MHGGITFVNETSFDIKDNTTDAFTVKEGTNKYIDIDTNNGSELITFGTVSVDIDFDLNIDGGDLTTNATTFNLLETNTTTINAFGTVPQLMLVHTGTFTLNNPTLVGTQTTQTYLTLPHNGKRIWCRFCTKHWCIWWNNTLRSGTLVGTQTTQNVFNTTQYHS